MMKNRFDIRIQFMTFLSLIPLILFGLYKNGISLYQRGLVGRIEAFKPLIILLMGVVGVLLGSIIREYKTNKNIKDILEHSKILIVESLILGMMLPINSSPLILFGVTFIMGLFFRRLEVNRIAVFYGLMEIINKILGTNSFANIYENSTKLELNGLDMFLGSNIGGICSTNILLVLLALIFLSFNKLYKKDIAYSSILTYVLLVIGYAFIKENYGLIFPLLFGYNTMFIFTLVAPSTYSSSYTEKGQIISGILLAFITFAFHKIFMYNSSILGVIIISLLRKYIDKWTVMRLK